MRALALLAITFAVSVGCVPGPDAQTRLTEGVVVATKFDPAVNFSSFSTFATVDVVNFIGPQPDAGLDPATSQAIIEQVAAQWIARGYRRVPRTDRPDLGINVTLVVQNVVATSVAPNSFWGSPAYLGTPAVWGFAGAGYYAPWSYVTGAWQDGTLSIEADDIARGLVNASAGAAGTTATAPTDLEVAWAAYLHGALANPPQASSPELEDAIAQAFAQSPYLHHP
jgi:hypothetical protein